MLCIQTMYFDASGMCTHMHGITFGKMVLVNDQHSLQMLGTKYVRINQAPTRVYYIINFKGSIKRQVTILCNPF